MEEETLTEMRYWCHNQLNGAVTFAVLTTFFVSLRCIGLGILNWKKKIRIRFSFWEDVLILASLVAFLPLCACAIVHAHLCLALHSLQVTQQDDINKLKASYGLIVAYPIACVLPKISICCMYIALFRPNVYLRRATYAMIAFLVVNAIAWSVPSVALCQPISAYWNLEPAKCINIQALRVWITLSHVVSDLAILILPLPVLWKTQMKRTKKLGVTITFLIGSIGIVGACIRLALYIRVFMIKGKADDVIIVYVEPGMYLIAACLPRLRPLIMQLHSRLRASFSTLLGRYHGSDDPLPSPAPGRQGLGSENRRLAPRVDVKLTGQGNLDSLTTEKEEEDAVSGSS